MKHLFVTMSASLILAACAAPDTKRVDLDSGAVQAEAAKQQRLVAQNELDHDIRVLNIADRILRNGVDLCGEKVTRDIGARIATLAAVNKDWREAYAEVYRLDADERATVYHVAPFSPADDAGLSRGDVILVVNGAPLRDGKKAAEKASETIREAAADGSGRVALQVMRDGQIHDVGVQPVAYCDSSVHRVSDGQVNAFATGRAVAVTDGMMRFVENDDELALVIGHEVAHNAKLHIEKQKKNAMGGAFLGAVVDILAAAGGVDTGGEFTRAGANAGAGTYSVEFEQEADYVGIYLTKRAGFDISVAPAFWRRMATVNPNAVLYAGTHPTTAERFLALDEVTAEVDMKARNMLALVPEALQDGGASPAGGTPTRMAISGSGNTSGGKGLVAGSTNAGPGTAASTETALAATETAAGGGYGLILGTYSNSASLAAAWGLLQAEHDDLLGALGHREVADGQGGLMLITGPLPERTNANAICEQLRQRHQYCAVETLN